MNLLEETDPELAAMFMDICSGKFPVKVFNEDIYTKDNRLIAVSLEIGRNDPCSCGSGKKYKKCCINK